MFTGIIESVGVVTRRHHDRLHLGTGSLDPSSLRLGESVAVDGVDLTVTDLDDHGFAADVMPETLRRSTLGRLRTGDHVNLERSLTLETMVSGHLVRGVVEGTAHVLDVSDDVTPEATARLLRLEAAPDLCEHVVVKGPVALAGVSLTATARSRTEITVSLVRHTLDHTTLARLRPGDLVNLETDLLSRYVAAAVTAQAERSAAGRATP